MIGICHAVKRAHRLALASRGNQRYLFGLELFDLADIDQRSLRNVHISEPRRNVDDIQHTASRYGDLSTVAVRAVDDLLYAVNVGGKGGDDNALITAAENVFKRTSDRALGHGISGALGVGGIGKQSQNTRVSEFAEAGKIDRLALYRRKIDLKVAREQKRSGRACHGDGTGIGNRVIDADIFNGKRTDL